MPDDDLDAVFKALADPTRRAILDLLRGRERTTGELASSFPDLTRFAIMKHIGVLEDAGLVATRKDGRRRWKHLNVQPLRRMYERWVSPYADLWATSLGRLKDQLEAPEGAHGDDR
jgi:DNA-binding transcriptional ArsR family regulator